MKSQTFSAEAKGSQPWAPSGLLGVYLGLPIIVIGVATCLLGLRLIAWMNESDNRMRMLEKQVAAMQDTIQSEQQPKQSPQQVK